MNDIIREEINRALKVGLDENLWTMDLESKVVAHNLSELLFDIKTGEGPDMSFDMDPDELEDACRLLLPWFGMRGYDYN
jgi:hypothetical protein